MKEIICEMCGSNDIIKQDGVYVCQSCGTKYSPEEAKKLMVEGTVTIDKSSEKENLKTLAKRYYENREYEKADDYYDRIIELDPHDWEAVYYGGLASAQRSTFDNLRLDEAIIGYENALEILSPEEKAEHLEMFKDDLFGIAMQTSSFIKQGGFGADLNAVMLYLNNLVYTINCYEKILSFFPDEKLLKNNRIWDIYTDIVDSCTRLQMKHQYQWGYYTDTGGAVFRDVESSEYKAFGKAKEDEYLPKLKAIDDEYKPAKYEEPGGCYVATCVYGSYDCPEVWTLRRFRDNTLKQSIFGRAFIKCYYATSPTIVKYFGDYKVFNSIFKPILDKFVNKLQDDGIDSTIYFDE